MENPAPPLPNNNNQPQTAAPPAVQIDANPPRRASLAPLWLAAGLAIIFGIAGLVIWQKNTPAEPTGEFTISPTSAATPTPLRLPSSIASQSAFVSWEAKVASLSNSLRTAVIQDPSLTPPVIELPLGFSNE